MEAEVDSRVTKAILEVNDPQLILDLRECNGKVNASHFDKFWEELQVCFTCLLLHLHELIFERLKVKYPENCPPVPSLEWVRLQFWPSNQYTMRALKYTAKLRVKFGVKSDSFTGIIKTHTM